MLLSNRIEEGLSPIDYIFVVFYYYWWLMKETLSLLLKVIDYWSADIIDTKFCAESNYNKLAVPEESHIYPKLLP